MLITIERRASCSMFVRSCKHPISLDLRNIAPTWLAGSAYLWTSFDDLSIKDHYHACNTHAHTRDFSHISSCTANN